MQASSNFTVGEYQMFSSFSSQPMSVVILPAITLSSLSIWLNTESSGWRRSTEKKTDPGITLREFGFTSTKPTVETASGAWFRAITLTPSTIRAQASMASFRKCIGVLPAWLSRPITVISYQRWLCTPVTTPIILFSASRTGPCSM